MFPAQIRVTVWDVNQNICDSSSVDISALQYRNIFHTYLMDFITMTKLIMFSG